jgi:hypothetical protein
MKKIGRNDPCPCGSENKYKKCCFLDEAKNKEILRARARSKNQEEFVEMISKPMGIYRLKVFLVRMLSRVITEEVSRTIEVEGKHTLYDFHLAIQDAFGWDNDHMFSFYMGNKLNDKEKEYKANPLGEHMPSRWDASSKSATTAEIRDLALGEGSNFLYLFDYGDELVHEIAVEKIREKTDNDKKYPALVAKIGQAPKQYPAWA